MKIKFKRTLKTLALIMAFVIIVPLSYGVGYAIGSYQNNAIKALPEETHEKVRVMTFNICASSVGKRTWEERTDDVINILLDSNADSFGLQEATPYWMSVLTSEISSEYDYVGVGSNNATGFENNDDYNDEFTAIFYLKDKYNVADSGYFWLSETPDKPSFGWGSAYIRICTWVILENKTTKTKYVHINTHFDNESSEARRNSISMILSKAEEFKEYPVVFTGDLNFFETSRGYKDITAGILRDVKTFAVDTMNSQTFNGANAKEFKNYVLDYILVNNKFITKTYKVETKKSNRNYISDHYPVIADLEIY